MLISSHKLQRILRQKRIDVAIERVKKKDIDEYVVQNGLLKRNELAETKLLEGLPSEQTIDTLPIERFKIPLKDELKAFVHVRLLQTSKVPKNKIIP